MTMGIPSGSSLDGDRTPLLLFCTLYAIVSFLESCRIFNRARRADTPLPLK